MGLVELPALPKQGKDTPWPGTDWPMDDLPAACDQARFSALCDHAFAPVPPADLAETHALVVIHKGRLVHERYALLYGPDVTCPSWSMAKSITHALVGILVGDGKINIFQRADVPEWQDAGDPRHAITLDLLLRMSSGLKFTEEYLPDQPSDVIEMLWGRGAEDTGHFAASFALAHEPGKFWSYSSGTTNIVSRCAARAVGISGAAFGTFMRSRLFDVLGMTSATPKFDAAGTFIGSSFCFCTPRDFARFGLLYLRDGIWKGQRILPEGWVDYARTPTWQQPNDQGRYGAHWWLDPAGPGSFSANGYEGQFIFVVPDRDLVIVRNGRTPVELSDNVKRWIADVAACFSRA